MLRFALLLLLAAPFVAAPSVFAQVSSSSSVEPGSSSAPGPVSGSVSGSASSSAPGSAPGSAQTAPQPEPLSPQMTAAEAAIANNDWKTAAADLDAWLAAHPSDARALFDAGYVADTENHASQAKSFYQRAVAANPNSFNVNLMLGLLLAREGELSQARPLLARATDLDPGEGGPELKARAWRALARIDSASNPAEASNDLIEALKLSPETARDMLLAAELAEKSGDAAEAEAEYRRVLAKDPASEPANAGLAQLLIRRQQYPEAETLLRAALAHDSGNTVLTAQLAGVLAAQDKAEALPMLEKLYAANPGEEAIMRMLAQMRADAGNFAGSDALYVKLLAAAPQDQELLVGHASNLVHEQKDAQAYAVFEKVTKLDPANAEGWGGLAFTASRIGRPSVTLHALTMRSELEPENASTYFLWATAYDSLNQEKQAAVYYHHFLDAAAGKFPNEEWQARQRLKALGHR